MYAYASISYFYNAGNETSGPGKPSHDVTEMTDCNEQAGNEHTLRKRAKWQQVNLD